MLKQYISLKLAANALLVALSILLIFHILVLTGLIPADMVWGGRVETNSQLYVREIGALVLTAVMLYMVAVRVDYVKAPKVKDFAQTAMWVIFVVLVLNTLGNLSSFSGLETLIFTPITIILAVFAYRLAMREG